MLHRSLALFALVLVALASTAGAVHFYRGPGRGCSPADGALGDAPAPGGGATVLLMHNTFHDATTGVPVTRVAVGDSVTWTWNSAHCHSVVGVGFYSGFHYPASEPTTPAVAPDVFHYPVPEVEPTLSYTRVFTAPGTYTYLCEHHATIGMRGVVLVE